jgi:dihydroorotase
VTNLAIRGGRVIDPRNGVDAISDVVIEDGRISDKDASGASETIDASGLIVAPGFVDIHTHLREPGFEHKETIETGTMAAARGGFTTVCAMPNTEPPIDSAAGVEFVTRRAAETGAVRVLSIACVTRRREGRELVDMAELARAGAVAFSDDGSPVSDAGLMRRAIEYSGMLSVPIIDHCEDPALAGVGVMQEGWVSTRLGLPGVPAAAEETMVARNIALAEQTGCRVHLAHVSTAGSVELLRQAKARGVAVTAEVTPHHLALTHELVMTGAPEASGRGGTATMTRPQLAYDTNAKVNPPLRTAEDAEACVTGLIDGTIDCIATDHAPHAIQDKLCEFDHAAFGISGLETALGLCLERLPIETAIARLTAAPAAVLGLDERVRGCGSLSVGGVADVVLIDPEAEWVVEPALLASKGKNTPLAGRSLKGRVVMAIVDGKVAWDGR